MTPEEKAELVSEAQFVEDELSRKVKDIIMSIITDSDDREFYKMKKVENNNNKGDPMTKQIAIQIANRLATKLANDLTTLLDGFKAECERIVAQIPDANTPSEQPAQEPKQ